MVQVQRKRNKSRRCSSSTLVLVLLLGGGLYASLPLYFGLNDTVASPSLKNEEAIAHHGTPKNSLSIEKDKDKDKDIHVPNKISATHSTTHKCSYKSLQDLQEYEKNPRAKKELDGNQRRHMVTPPPGGKVTLVCCDTTVGRLSIAVHHTWAPLGAQRFLDMVRDEYFSSKVAFMRCIKNFLCQFGIAGIPSLNKKYKSFQDDPNWLPEGPSHRTNVDGVKRFARGYFAYAGGGKNSRGNQLIVALKDNERLGGGSPWEVPFGEVVGAESYVTLGKISTAYGEKGPSQPMLRKEGSSSNVAEKFPKLDYMTSCIVVDERFMQPDEITSSS